MPPCRYSNEYLALLGALGVFVGLALATASGKRGLTERPGERHGPVSFFGSSTTTTAGSGDVIIWRKSDKTL